jgi:16S rRNA (uracil1498-N3)-methyltransferase
MKFSTLPRIYYHSILSANTIIEIDSQHFHYLKNVLRLKINSPFRIFNGINGEFIATVREIKKNTLSIHLNNLIRKTELEQNLILGICIIKADKMLDAINMAVQIGVTKIVPLIAQRSQLKTVNHNRLFKCVIEATEQSERLTPPSLEQAILLKNYRSEYCGAIIYANENENNANSLMASIDALQSNFSFIVGPEGGFSNEELEMFSSWLDTFSISLGSNILRTETAVAAGLAQIMLLKKFRH